MYDIEDYNFNLRKELIAQVPAPDRDGSRLLFVDRHGSSFSDHHFFDLPGLLKPGDLLVVNNTKVTPAKLYGRKDSGGKVEILVLEHQKTGDSQSDSRWCLLRSSKRPRRESRLVFEEGIWGIVKELSEEGLTKIRFHGPVPIDKLIEEKGEMPLPHYIKRGDTRLSSMDRERYQTIFSKNQGAIAAPTAGLHFTESSIKGLRRVGVDVVELTLHIGHGTFRPVREKDIRRHRLGEESYIVEQGTAQAINMARLEGRRIIAVGTTVVRTLESIAGQRGEITPGKGKTELLITPGFKFRVVDGIITNFHLPRSSLLFLVSAFGGMDLIKRAYSRAMEKEYRFFSYGDAMLII
jgi:S-adenosylmethionine:tRNA ribosyltransferase-isomerase